MTCGIDTGCSGNCNQSRNCPSRNVAHTPLGNIAISGVIVAFFVLCLAWAGPGNDDHSGEQSAASDAINQIKRDEHIAAAGKKVCGENAAWQIEGDTIQCFTHRGAKTITAKVAP